MTFAAVGGLLQADETTSPFTVTPGGVGDLILLEIVNKVSNTIPVTGLSSSNATWTQMGANFAGSTNPWITNIWAGKVTSTSGANVAITWGGTTPTSFRLAGQEFSSSAGSWALDQQGSIDTPGTSTSAFASLSPAAAGELYFGYAVINGGVSAGSTPGYTYDVDAHGNALAFNPACTSSAQAPVWGSSNVQFGTMILVKEVVTGTPVLASVKSSFEGYKSVTAASATMEFEAGQPVQLGLTTLARDPWFQMYPG